VATKLLELTGIEENLLKMFLQRLETMVDSLYGYHVGYCPLP
jgi:hypothetical protein